jgi:hypothetical protein
MTRFHDERNFKIALAAWLRLGERAGCAERVERPCSKSRQASLRKAMLVCWRTDSLQWPDAEHRLVRRGSGPSIFALSVQGTGGDAKGSEYQWWTCGVSRSRKRWLAQIERVAVARTDDRAGVVPSP